MSVEPSVDTAPKVSDEVHSSIKGWMLGGMGMSRPQQGGRCAVARVSFGVAEASACV